MPGDLDSLVSEIRACRICRDKPHGKPLQHEPRPVLRVSATARIGVFGQAPGVRVHASGKPFTDPSGVRLRLWMNVTEDEFYDTSRIAILPMGFCFPGLDASGSDFPPRPECARTWRAKVMEELKSLEVILLIGGYAQAWHLGKRSGQSVSEAVAGWRSISRSQIGRKHWPLPHPSWRNNHWLKQNPWFETELLPAMRRNIRRALNRSGSSN